MSPQENRCDCTTPAGEISPLLVGKMIDDSVMGVSTADLSDTSSPSKGYGNSSITDSKCFLPLVVTTAVIAMAALGGHHQYNNNSYKNDSIESLSHVGPYKVKEHQKGEGFFSFYDFYEGPDIPGSGGFNDYVSMDTARDIGILNVTSDGSVYMGSVSTGSEKKYRRQAIRLEGKTRFDRGLFVIDLDHMPAGCGVWPAFWLSDDEDWPNGGEIDIVEGINYQSRIKTALHTSDQCSMYNQVPSYAYSGFWEKSTGLYDRFTGIQDNESVVNSDNCFAGAPHQWPNQGCVLVSDEDDTLGVPLNKKGGGVVALEWDPENGYIRSWAFTPHNTVPQNLAQAIATAGEDEKNRVEPNTEEWGLPFSYFAIGEGTNCDSNHFKQQRLIINLAFCGSVAGNRFYKDCPDVADDFRIPKEWKPVESCERYVMTEPDEIQNDAYWKINSVNVWERSLSTPTNATLGDKIRFS